jgi:hypothetical protein
MRSHNRILAVVALAAPILLLAASAHAQIATDPSGHWEGKIEVPGMDVAFEVDLAKTAGAYIGTVGIPSQKLKGLPLVKVAVEGKTVTFAVRTDQTMTGDVSDDGKTMSGTFAGGAGSVPFIMTKTGDARVTPPATSAPISKELEGTWTSTVEDTGNHVVLTLTNHADGTATGSLVNQTEGGLQIPVRVTQNGASVAFAATVLEGSFSGELNATGTELAGTWREGTVSKTIAFRKSKNLELRTKK